LILEQENISQEYNLSSQIYKANEDNEYFKMFIVFFVI
jgi:hypothetical protein